MESPKIDYIQSKDNKTIKHIISLQQRKYRQKFGEYTVEGIRAVTDIGKKDCLRSILIRESKRSELEPLVQKGFTVSSVYVVQDPIFDKIEHSVNGQGILGIAKKCVNDLHSLIVEDGLYVALDGVQDPGNLGTIIRTAVAAGVKGIFLMKGTVDPFNDKTVRSTMSALHKIPLYEDITLSLLHDMVTESNMTTYVTALEHSNPYHTVRYAKRTMLVLGNEGNGVTPEVMNLCTNRIMIPMYGDAKLVEWACKSYLGEIVEAGAKVLLYKAGFNHSKLLVSDDYFCTCGSTNIDFRSFENNFECNIFFYDKDLALRIKEIYLNDEKDCVDIEEIRDYTHRSFATRLWESIVRLLSPLL